jgi:restriction system protein
MKSYYRVMLGHASVYAKACFAGGFIGVDFEIPQDLTKDLPDDWRAFNKKFIPIYLASHAGKTKVGAGLACGALWTVAKGIKEGDTVISPDGQGHYRVGEVTGGYSYQPTGPLPHRRTVKWLSDTVDRSDMSQALKNSTGSIGAVADITRHRDEVEALISGLPVAPALLATDPTVEDPGEFAMESHLEEFLIQNWGQTELGKQYDIYEVDGERVGQQYQTDTGPMDILAISKDKKRLLVVELKKGRASDAVVGQTMRYMGYVGEVLAEAGQTVQGVIIAHDDDPKIRRALSVVPHIAFYRYQVIFKLLKN